MVARQLHRVFDRALAVLAYFAGVLVVLMMLSICYEVVMRRFLERPTIWVTDVSSYILLFITFLAAAWVLKGDHHVKIDILLTRLQPRTQAATNCVTSFLGIVACAVFSWKAWELACLSHRTGSEFYRGLVIPEYILLWPVFLGSCLLSIQFALRTWQSLHAFGSSSAEEPKESD